MIRLNTLKRIVLSKTTLGVTAILILGTTSYILFSETNTEMQERIASEIQIIKMRNISFAEIKVNDLTTNLIELESQVNTTKNDIHIYQECIKLNETKDLPTNCKDVTISLKEDLDWKVNSNGVSQEYKQLIGDTPKARASYLLDGFAHTKGTIDIWIELGREYNIDPYIAISIAKADSSLGQELKTKNNIGNVGNNDRGDTVSYDTKADGIEAIFKTLNNQYLGKIFSLGYLSCGGKTALGITDCFQNGEKVYATSKENWNANVINSMRMIYRDGTIDEGYNFRTIKTG